MKAKLFLAVVLGLVSMLLLACTSASATPTPTKAPAAAQATATPAPVKGGTLKAGVREEPTLLDPHVPAITGGYASVVIYENLTSFNEKGELLPELAESWDVAPDGKTITFKLRKGVKFHDGSDFNAAAVKFNMERLNQPTVGKRTYLVDVDSVDVVDDYTVKFALKRPSAPLLMNLADVGGWIVSPAAVQKYGQDYGRNPSGTGPFQLEEWVKNSYHRVKRFDGYWNPSKVYLDKITYNVIPDETVRATNLRTGQVDWIHEVNPKDVDTLKNTKDLVLYETTSYGWYRFSFQNAKAPFNSKPLRQAIAYAWDAEAVLKAVFMGHGVMAAGPFSPASWANDPNAKPIRRDVAKAKAKLAEAGKAQGFEFTLSVMNVPTYQAMAEVIQAQLAEAGIKMKFSVQDSAEAIGNLARGDYEALFSMNPGWVEPDESTWAEFHSKSAANRVRYSNPQLDEVLDKARTTYSRDERKKVYNQAVEIIMDEVPLAFLFHPPLIVSANQKVQNYKIFPPASYLIFKSLKDVWLKQ